MKDTADTAAAALKAFSASRGKKPRSPRASSLGAAASPGPEASAAPAPAGQVEIPAGQVVHEPEVLPPSATSSPSQAGAAVLVPMVVDEVAPLTADERKFLDYYLLGDMNQEQAISLAMPEACVGMSVSWMKLMAGQIVRKYEQSAGEVAKIFSDIGLGQAAIALKIKKLIDTASSDTVKLNALTLAAKCVGMAREVEVQPQRISIILNVGQGGTKPDPAAGRPALAYQEKVGLPSKPLAITK